MTSSASAPSASRTTGIVFLIAAASAALAYLISPSSWQSRTVSITPPVATPAKMEKIEPAAVNAPQAAPPAPAAAPAVQAAPLIVPLATAIHAQKKRKPRHHKQ